MKKYNKKSTATPKLKGKAKAQKKAVISPKTTFWQQHSMALKALFLLGFLLYAYSISFEYALDDRLYIIDNKHTKQGLAGIPKLLTEESLHGFFGETKDLLVGGRYRPLALITYAVEWQFLGSKPGFSHFLNIILYGLTGLLLYRLLCQLIPPKITNKSTSHRWYLTLPFIATALFLAHPLHSEVIANIKGRVELMTLFGALTTLYLTIRYLDTKDAKYLIFSGIAFFLAMLSKESAITFLAVIPLTHYCFTKASFKDSALSMFPVLLATIVFLVIRYQVLGYFLSSGTKVTELLNDPFVNATLGERYATIFYTLGAYIQLLFAPITLTHDYYPKQIPIVDWSNLQAIFSLVLYILMGLLALWGLFFRPTKHKIWAYGIAIYLTTFSIVSNVFFPIGTFMNERFMYIPSIGFCLIIAYFLTRILPKYTAKLPKIGAYDWQTLLFAGLLIAYSVRTLARVPAWQNNETLFLTDVNNSPNSTKANTSAGGILIELYSNKPDSPKRTKEMKRGVTYLEKAIKIYPDNTNALLLLGAGHFDLNKNYDKMFVPYYTLLETNPEHFQVQRNLNLMADTEENPANVRKLVDFLEQKVLPLKPQTAKPYDALGVLYGKKLNLLDKSIEYLLKALDFQDKEVGTYHDLAVAYGMKGNFGEALKMAHKALEIDPNNAKTYLNIGVTYQNMGNKEKAEEYLNQAFSLDPSLKRQ